jgi:hypothetical protein
LIPTIFVTLFVFLSLKNDVNIASKSHQQKKIVLKNYFFVVILKVISRKNCVKKLFFCWHLENQ